MQSSLFQIVYGYIIITIFNNISLRRNNTNTEHILLSSLAVGFIYDSIMRSVFDVILQYTKFDHVLNKLYPLILLIISVIVTYISARFYMSKLFDGILNMLKVRQSKNPNTWAELMDINKAMAVKIVTKSGMIFKGYIHHIGENDGLIALAAYDITDRNGSKEILSDNQILIIDIKDMEYMELAYNHKSDKIERIKSYTDIVRRFKTKKEGD